MLIPKKNRQAIYTYLFNEGVICAKKDFNAPKHHAIDVPNLYVIKALQSLKSKGFVTEKFSWQWYYWYLTNEGTNRLREYLHLAEEVVPATLKATKKSAESRGDGGYRGERYDREGGGYRGGGRGRGSYDRGDREGYRGSGGYGDDKKSTPPPGDFVPSFREGGDRGGRGRGFGGRGGYDREGGDRGGYRGEGGEGGGYRGGYRGGDRGDRGEGGGYRGDGGYRGGDREGGFGRGRGRGDSQGGGEYRRSEGGYRGGGGGGEGGFSRGRGGPPRG